MFGFCCPCGPDVPDATCEVCVEAGHPLPDWLVTIPSTLIAQAPECPQSLGGDYLFDWDRVVDLGGTFGACQWKHVMVDRIREVTRLPPTFNPVCGAFNKDLTWYLQTRRLPDGLGGFDHYIIIMAYAEGYGGPFGLADATWQRTSKSKINCNGTVYSIPFLSRLASGFWGSVATLPNLTVKVVN